MIEIRNKPTTNATPPTDSRLSQLLRWEHSSETPPARTYNPSACTPVDPSFRPMASAPQTTIDRIWSRILWFAMLSLEQHPQKISPWQLEVQKINSARLQFLLVSKLFKRLALPYLYRCPVFPPNTRLSRFSQLLFVQPTIGGYIWELDTCALARGGTSILLPSILLRTCNLTHLIGHRDHQIPWAAFTTLAAMAGGTLQEFTGFSFKFDLSSNKDPYSPAVFSYFTALPADEAVALPALEFLSIHSPEALSVFSQMSLPSIQRAQFHLSGDWDITFLGTHGNQIEHLEVRKPTIDKQSVFKMCPNMTTLDCRVVATDDYDLGCSALGSGFKHTFLSKMIVDKDRVAWKIKNEKDWERFFQNLDLSYLPALREISILQCEWPTTE
ncbi:hypothetical protein B0H19DRAFT_1245673 [Mycena capillaripes]|nr:hypothetical protein B0H19DRAFT_1245673 [Mycena capillaripes]